MIPNFEESYYPYLIITRGIPGCGKSTFSKDLTSREKSVVRFSNDEARLMLTGWNASHGIPPVSTEKLVDKLRAEFIMQGLSSGFDVIVDNLNISNKFIHNYRRIAEEHGAKFGIVDFSQAPLGLCLQRNSNREHPVPEKFIREMHRVLLINNEKFQGYSSLVLEEVKE